MRGGEELVARLAQRRREKLGGLSDAGYEELLRAVKEDPKKFIDCPEDQAFCQLVEALGRYERAQRGEEFLDDAQYRKARHARRARLASDCLQALETDPACTDAELCCLLLKDLSPDRLLDALLTLDGSANEAHGPITVDETGDAWSRLSNHARLRVRAAIVRACLDTARYGMACELGLDLLRLAPSDAVGARHTCALAYARLEDEEGFDALDARFDRHGDCWTHLGRTILLYKLGRMGAARRALRGYASLCEGGAYALLRPIFLDTYLPDRPEEKPCSFGEATLAVHEADPIIVDIPDFALWSEQQPDVARAAQDFANRSGFDW